MGPAGIPPGTPKLGEGKRLINGVFVTWPQPRCCCAAPGLGPPWLPHTQGQTLCPRLGGLGGGGCTHPPTLCRGGAGRGFSFNSLHSPRGSGNVGGPHRALSAPDASFPAGYGCGAIRALHWGGRRPPLSALSSVRIPGGRSRCASPPAAARTCETLPGCFKAPPSPQHPPPNPKIPLPKPSRTRDGEGENWGHGPQIPFPPPLREETLPPRSWGPRLFM